MNEVLLCEEYNREREMKQEQSGPDHFQDTSLYAYYNSNETEGPAATDTSNPNPKETLKLQTVAKSKCSFFFKIHKGELAGVPLAN